MIVLPGTSDVIRIITSAAVALDAHVDYVDHTTSAYTPGRQNTAITTATTTTICSAPAASTQRQVKHMTICARGGANTVTVQYFDGATAFQMVGSFSLADEEILEYTDTDGFRVLDSTGTIRSGAGITATDTVQGVSRFATQAEMESETPSLIVTPERVKYSPGVCKCWGFTTGGGSPVLNAQSYNVTSIASPGTGRLTVTIATDFSSADWVAQATPGVSTGSCRIVGSLSKAAGSVELQSETDASTLSDPATGWDWAFFGDQ